LSDVVAKVEAASAPTHLATTNNEVRIMHTNTHPSLILFVRTAAHFVSCCACPLDVQVASWLSDAIAKVEAAAQCQVSEAQGHVSQAHHEQQQQQQRAPFISFTLENTTIMVPSALAAEWRGEDSGGSGGGSSSSSRSSSSSSSSSEPQFPLAMLDALTYWLQGTSWKAPKLIQSSCSNLHRRKQLRKPSLLSHRSLKQRSHLSSTPHWTAARWCSFASLRSLSCALHQHWE
jgi:hypothetical protein